MTIQIILLPKKSFLAYPLVRLPGQRVNDCGMATVEAKLAAITQLAFSLSLKDFDAYLGLIRYLRQYIPYYAQIARLFQKRKTLLNWSVNIGGNAHQKVMARMYIIMPTDKELNTFHHLQQFFL